MVSEFKVVHLNVEGMAIMNSMTNAFNDLLDHIIEKVPEGPELSIVKNKLEEAFYFARKGIGKNPELRK